MSVISVEEQRVRRAEPYIGEAMSLASSLATARSPEDAQNIIASLGMLATRTEVMASSKASLIVSGIISTGERIFTYLSNAEALETAAEVSRQYRLDEKRDSLANNLADKGIFSKQELAYLESIDPKAERKITALDNEGQDKGNKEIKGQELRDSYAIRAAYEKQDELDPEALKEYNRLVYGNENGPQNEAERKRGQERIKQAVKDTEGDAAARAKENGDERGAKEAGKRAKEEIDALETADAKQRERLELERNKETLVKEGKWTPGMEAASKPIIERAKEEEEASKKTARDTLADARRDIMATVMSDAPAQSNEQENTVFTSPKAQEEKKNEAPSKGSRELENALMMELSRGNLGQLTSAASLPKAAGEQSAKYI